MNQSTDDNTPENNPPAESAAPHHPNLLAGRLSISQMIFVVVLVLFGWQWFEGHRQINAMQQELERRLAEMGGNNKANKVLVTEIQKTTHKLAEKVTLLEAHNAEQLNQRAALESLYQELSSSRDETTLAQVEQILMIASQQLQISANVKAALIAMQQADDYLKRMNRPSLNSLRKAIALDIDKLHALPNVDTQHINNQLDLLAAMVETLPLTQDIELPPNSASSVSASPEKPFWRRLAHEAWDDAKQLVQVENTEQQILPLLPPNQLFFLRENLKLRLMSARLALLSHNEITYKGDLFAAQNWISRYFNIKTKSTIQALDALKKLRASGIRINIPDISNSLEAVRRYRGSHEKAAT